MPERFFGFGVSPSPACTSERQRPRASSKSDSGSGTAFEALPVLARLPMHFLQRGVPLMGSGALFLPQASSIFTSRMARRLSAYPPAHSTNATPPATVYSARKAAVPPRTRASMDVTFHTCRINTFARRSYLRSARRLAAYPPAHSTNATSSSICSRQRTAVPLQPQAARTRRSIRAGTANPCPAAGASRQHLLVLRGARFTGQPRHLGYDLLARCARMKDLSSPPLSSICARPRRERCRRSPRAPLPAPPS